MWRLKEPFDISPVKDPKYQDSSFILVSRNNHNFYLGKIQKNGCKMKINNNVLKSISYIHKFITTLTRVFRRRLTTFIYGLFYNFLFLNCKAFLTKTYKVEKRKRQYNHVFLLKENRPKEIIS